MQKSLRMTQVTWRCTVFLHHWMAIIHYNNWLRINRLLTNARNGDMQKSLLLCKKVKENLQCYLFITALVLLLTTKSELDSWASSSSQMPEVEKYCRNLCNLQEHDIASKSKESNVTSSQYSGVLEVSPCVYMQCPDIAAFSRRQTYSRYCTTYHVLAWSFCTGR